MDIVEKRRSLAIPGYRTLAEVGFDGDWVSPYQISSRSADGPCLVAYNWLDAPSVIANSGILHELGYLPKIPFNEVMRLALACAGLDKKSIYVTQAFHLLPMTRSASISQRHVDQSFDAVTKYETIGRKVIALGEKAAIACRRHGVEFLPVCHPSSRRHGTYEDRARIIAAALRV
jgi:hypothetical protein